MFADNATGLTTYKTVSGPFQFGEAVQLDKTKSECLTDNDFINAGDLCFTNPVNCRDGLSMSLFYQSANPNDAGTPGVKEYILSTGGESGIPGVGIYFDGVDLCVRLSTGSLTWSLNVAGQRPTDSSWYNIAIRWSMPTYANATDFQIQKMNNAKTKDFGGLELFVNMKSIGYVLLPDEVGCALTNPTVSCPNNGTGGRPLAPPEVLLGCHKTFGQPTKRSFGSGIFDEVAFWKKRLNDTELPYFLGGYKNSLENIALSALLQILQSVDMSDSGQANTAISVVDTIVSGPAQSSVPSGNIYQTTTPAPPTTTASGNGPTTTTAATTTTSAQPTTTTTTPDPSVEMRKLVKVMNTLTDSGAIPPGISQRTFEIFFNVASPVGGILSTKGKYHDGWETMNANPDDAVAHDNRESLEEFLVTLLKSRTPSANGDVSYSGMRVGNNYAVQLQKLSAQDFSALTKAGDTNFHLPNWQDGNWTNFRGATGMGSLPVDSAKIPTNIFSGACKTQPVNLLYSMFDTFPDPGRKNPATIPANDIVLDSRLMTINITADPLQGQTSLCLPDPKLLLSYPLTIDFAMTSGFKISAGSSRSLKFHDENLTSSITARYCAIWNPDLNGIGGWDTTGVKSIYSDDTVTSCFSTRLGTFAVIGQMYDTPYAEPDFAWLMAVKMVGYFLSFTVLIIFVAVVCMSNYLWEMFHIIGMNLALAVFSGDLSMVLSELVSIRLDRHLCAAAGISTNFFYTAAAFILLMESHAIFRAITTGIIGGKTKAYLCIGWGVPFLSVGVNIYLQLLDMGDDPRCMVGYSNWVKWFFFVPVIFASAFSLVAMLVVMCNLQAPALRKRSLILDHSNLAKGMFVLVFIFTLCWSWAPVAYIEFPGTEMPSFYPAFQVLNSFIGFFVFVCIGLGSREFRAEVKRQIDSHKKRS